ncbi:ABC transporter ATP-binding protein [Blautia schinkii]|nr:ABC transporter ATP-binding protein [Blautia schinkii]
MELRLDRLTKEYGSKIAVDELSAVMNQGVYGLLGANGAGKTTLMRMICDILRPTTGEVIYDNCNISEMREEYRNILGYLPQDFGYYPNFTAEKFLLYMSSLKGLERQFARQRSEELLELVGLSQVKGKKIGTFSGGMKQRLGIAQALLNNPKILILDEPTAGLDPKERVRFRNLISAISQNKIVLLSTHIVSDVEYIAGHIFVMRDGKIMSQGRPEEIVKEVEGCVWELRVPAKEADHYIASYNVGNLRNEDGMCVLRIISGEAPDKSALQVKPNLEDLYLHCFADQGRGM